MKTIRRAGKYKLTFKLFLFLQIMTATAKQMSPYLEAERGISSEVNQALPELHLARRVTSLFPVLSFLNIGN
ncbi:MAG: hypothetical protein M3521_14400 [Acidobacteriota bacterium]|nr:hypothetical protein [Acidobacteriota bacterium]